MDHRVGTCSSCRQSYRIPASFRHNQARCKNCGGVVAIGPPPGAVPAPKPRRERAPEPVIAAPAPAEPSAPIAAVADVPPPAPPTITTPPPPAESHPPPPPARAGVRPLHLVAWAAAVALVAACWWAFSTEKTTTAADKRSAESASTPDGAARDADDSRTGE